MPAGQYAVTWDLAAATVTPQGGGMSLEFCRPLAEAVPKAQLHTMTISFPAGRLAVDWGTRQIVDEKGQCGFEVSAPPVRAHVSFTDGAGSGTGEYAIGSSNHPDEACHVRGAKFTLVRSAPP